MAGSLLGGDGKTGGANCRAAGCCGTLFRCIKKAASAEGYDQAELLAKEVAKERVSSGLWAFPHDIYQKQSTLKAGEKTNVCGAFVRRKETPETEIAGKHFSAHRRCGGDRLHPRGMRPGAPGIGCGQRVGACLCPFRKPGRDGGRMDA